MAFSVADLCQQRDLDASTLAQATGYDPARIEAIMQGRWTPSPAERTKIAAVFGVPADEIAWGHATPIQHLYGHGPG